MKLLALQGARGVAEYVFESWHLPRYGRDWKNRNHCDGKPDECCSYHRDPWRAWGTLLSELNEYSFTYDLKRRYGFEVLRSFTIKWDKPDGNALERLADL